MALRERERSLNFGFFVGLKFEGERKRGLALDMAFVVQQNWNTGQPFSSGLFIALIVILEGLIRQIQFSIKYMHGDPTLLTFQSAL